MDLFTLVGCVDIEIVGFILIALFKLFSVIYEDIGLIYLGELSRDDVHAMCPPGYDLPVIRTKEELERIQAFIGTKSKFSNISQT